MFLHRRIQKLGRKVGKRPVILCFKDFNEKTSVLSNSKKLKGIGIFVQNDYLQSTLTKGKKLWESAREDKAAGKNVFLINDKLRIDDDLYVWDESKRQRVRLTPVERLFSADQ